jgi:hypothetical protein
LLLLTVLVIYIVLGILYESFVHPITILSGLPAAGLGALLTLMLFGHDLTIFALIEIIMLIGIVKKNAIMMIDFALQQKHAGVIDPAQAIYEAALLRFRPIMMTHGGEHRHAADRARDRSRLKAAPAARHRGRRRALGLTGPDPLHHAGDLHLFRTTLLSLRARRRMALATVQPPFSRSGGIAFASSAHD